MGYMKTLLMQDKYIHHLSLSEKGQGNGVEKKDFPRRRKTSGGVSLNETYKSIRKSKRGWMWILMKMLIMKMTNYFTLGHSMRPNMWVVMKMRRQELGKKRGYIKAYVEEEKPSHVV